MKKILEKIDHWLCVRLKPARLRVWWCCLWIRAEEFHVSFNSDAEFMAQLDAEIRLAKQQRQDYIENLYKRRDVAHKRTL